MKYNFKSFLILVVFILSITARKNSFAQYPGMKAVYSGIAAQQAQMNMNMAMNSMSRFSNSQIINEKYAFQVTFKDSSKKIVYSKILMDTATKKTYLLQVDKKIPKSDMAHREQKIFVDQTAYITRIANSDALTGTTYITGLPSDSCWMFKVIKGSISAYSYLSESDKTAFNPGTIVAVQLNDGPIMKLTDENLNQIVADDKDALKLVKHKNYFKAITKYNHDMEKKDKK